MIDFVTAWSAKTELPARLFLEGLNLQKGKYHDWKKRYGKVNENNAQIPRGHWLERWEQQAILDFQEKHPFEGYRRLAFIMLDKDVVAASPSKVYRVLKRLHRLSRWNPKQSRKGQGFVQPLGPHEHWHVDIAYLNICGTFYYLCSVLDGYSRVILHHEIRESMKEADVEIVLQRAKELYPEARPRIISDNGPQFTARDFKEFIRQSGMTHVRTSPYYPQSNGKIEAWHKIMKVTAIRPKTPNSLEQAQTQVKTFVDHYNHVRLHSAIGYVTPADKLAGRENKIWQARDQKLEKARENRRARRVAQRLVSSPSIH